MEGPRSGGCVAQGSRLETDIGGAGIEKSSGMEEIVPEHPPKLTSQ